jgi:hypothetical protein
MEVEEINMSADKKSVIYNPFPEPNKLKGFGDSPTTESEFQTDVSTKRSPSSGFRMA